MLRKIDEDVLMRMSQSLCEREGWGRGWLKGGCYLHLEASEFIESLRGKGESTPEEELGDLLFVIYSMALHNDVSLDRARIYLYEKLIREYGVNPYESLEVVDDS